MYKINVSRVSYQVLTVRNQFYEKLDEITIEGYQVKKTWQHTIYLIQRTYINRKIIICPLRILVLFLLSFLSYWWNRFQQQGGAPHFNKITLNIRNIESQEEKRTMTDVHRDTILFFYQEILRVKKRKGQEPMRTKRYSIIHLVFFHQRPLNKIFYVLSSNYVILTYQILASK